jgi:hypothetical protein
MNPYDLPLLLSGEVRDYAAGLIGNTIRALLCEPLEGRSGVQDVDVLVRAVSRLDPPAVRCCADCPRHALACQLAGRAVRLWLADRCAA